MAACSNIKEICLGLDKELNTVLEKKILKKISKKRTLEVLRVISERTKNKKGCDLNSILLNVDSDLLDNILLTGNVLLTLERLVDYGII